MDRNGFIAWLKNARLASILWSLAIGLTIYLCTGCYCNIASVGPSRQNVKVVSISSRFAVLQIPQPWELIDGQRVFSTTQSLKPVVWPDGDVERREPYVFDQYKFRRSRSDTDMFFVALHNSPVHAAIPLSLTSKNKFAFRWPYATDSRATEVSGLRRASEQEWIAAMPLVGNMKNRGVWRVMSGGEPCFSSWNGGYLLLSGAKGGPAHGPGGFSLDPGLLDFIYNPPTWTWFNILRASDRRQLATATVRSCDSAVLMLGAWHGESLYSIPLSEDQRTILLFRTPDPPREPSKSEMELPDSIDRAETRKPGPMAHILSLTEIQKDDKHDGRTSRILVRTDLDVIVPGKFQLTITLTASGGKRLTAYTANDLTRGHQQMWVSFRAVDIATFLGVDGPYQRVVDLLNEASGTNTNLDAGPSFYYKLRALDTEAPPQ